MFSAHRLLIVPTSAAPSAREGGAAFDVVLSQAELDRLAPEDMLGMNADEAMEMVRAGAGLGADPDRFDEIVCTLSAEVLPARLYAQAVFLDMLGKTDFRVTCRLERADAPAAAIDDAFERAGFALAGTPSDGPVRIYVRSAVRAEAGRMLVGVLDHDKKTSVYKLALLRAVAAAAVRSPAAVRFLTPEESDRRNRRVRRYWNYPEDLAAAKAAEPLAAVPFYAVVEAALEDFWRIWAAERIEHPERSSEDILKLAPRQISGSRHPEFHRALDLLMQRYACRWEAFRSALFSGRLSAEDERHYVDAVNALAETLLTNPVCYAGGSLADPAGTHRIFSVENRKRFKGAAVREALTAKWGDLVMPAAFWSEIRAHAPWLSDALMMHWGRLSSRFSKLAGLVFEPGDIVTRLMAEAAERDVGEAARVMDALRAQGESIRCIWTGEIIRPRDTDIDHMLPFSKLRSNDLWNLAPALRAVNNRKRDAVPSAKLLLARRQAIIEWWDHCSAHSPRLFRAQAASSLPGAGAAENPVSPEVLFEGMLFMSDMLARQFQCRRFDG